MSAPDNNSPLIDFEQLRAATDGDIIVMRELVALYFQQAGEIMIGLRKASRERDAAEANHLAHKLAGSSLACGMSAAAEPLRKIEAAARDGSVEGADEQLALATSYLEMMLDKIEIYLASYR